MADFVGVSDVHFWKVTADDLDNYTAGAVKVLSRTAEISQTTEQAQNVVYYSNIAAYAVSSRGATTLTAVLEALKLTILAELLDETKDATTGAVFDSGEAKSVSFGISFRADYVGEEGARYYSFPKVTISIPDEGTKTKDAGTDTVNQTVTITAVSTIHIFTGTNKTCKEVICDTENSGTLLDLTKFFDAAITPDSLATICARDPQVETPTATPSGASFASTQSVTLACSTVGATIKYTVDGTTPTATNGTIYSSAINLTETTTIKAIAFKTGMSNSAVMTETYTKQ